MPKIEVQDLTKIYDQVPAVDGVNMTVEDRELVALVGHSGCGKTTVLRMISGLTFPDRGRIWIDGRDITRLMPEDRDVVMVFQETLLFPHLTVAENIGFGLKMQGVGKKQRQKKTRELLELMQLPDISKRYPSELSGGQQQRVALARALALEPKVLLLDEPLTNLDPRLRDDLRDLILNLHNRLGMTTVLVTHDRDEAMMMADRIAVMHSGKLLQIDDPESIYRRPATREVAGLFGQCNFISGVLTDGTFETASCRFTHPALKGEGRVEACIRSEHIRVIRPVVSGDCSEESPMIAAGPEEPVINHPAGSPEDSTINRPAGSTEDCPPRIKVDRPSGVIVEKKFLGGQGILKVAVGDLLLVARGDNYFEFEVGDPVSLEIDWSQVAFLKQEE